MKNKQITQTLVDNNKPLFLLIVGFVTYIVTGLVLESFLLMDELEFAVYYATLTYPIMSKSIGKILDMGGWLL